MLSIVDKPARASTGHIDAYLGRRLLERRVELGATQAQVAATMNAVFGHDKWHPATVAAVESGRRNLSLDELGHLCMTLGVTLQQLAVIPIIQSSGPPPLPQMVGLWGDLSPELLAPDDVDRFLAYMQLERLQNAVLGRITGVERWFTVPAQGVIRRFFEAQVLEHYGHDLLAERDRRVAAGQGNRTWVSRRLVDEVAELPSMQWLRRYIDRAGSAFDLDVKRLSAAIAAAERRGWS